MGHHSKRTDSTNLNSKIDKIELENQVSLYTAELERANRELREIKAQFEAVYNHHYQMTGLIDSNGCLLMANRTALLFGGLEPEDVIGKHFAETPWWTHSEIEQSKLKEAMAKAMGGESAHFQSTHVSVDGETRNIDFRIRPVFDDHGKVIYLVPEGYDITERKQAEAALQRQARFDAIIARILSRFARSSAVEIDGCILMSLEEIGQFVGAESVYILVVSQDRSSWSATHNWVAANIPDYTERYQKIPLGTFEWAETKVMSGDVVNISSVSDYPEEATAERYAFQRDGAKSMLDIPLGGTDRQILGSLGFRTYTEPTKWIKDDYPRLRLVSEAIANVLERKQAEESLQRSEERFRGLVSTMQDIIYSISPAGKILFIGPQVERYGFAPEEIISRPIIDFIHPDDQEAVLDNLRDTVETGQEMATTFRLISKNGDIVWFEEIGRVVRDASGRISSISGTLRDISERMRSAELEAQLQQAQKMEAVGRLAGGVAHDFNNLLTGIFGYVQLCQDKVETDTKVHGWLNEIRIAAERSAGVTRQLLAFARKQTITPKIFDLNDHISGLLKLLRRLLQEDIELAWIPASDDSRVEMDTSQIDQILANLVVNARDAITGQGRVAIETKNVWLDNFEGIRQSSNEPGEYVLLSVQDTGCGMDQKTLDSIFEPFYTTKEVGKGTGLGLSTVYGIVIQNSGHIEVLSKPEQGTTFKIYFPRCIREMREKAKTELSMLPGGCETILLVEDDDAVRLTVEAHLEEMGYTVMSAESPNHAIQLAADHTGKIDLLLTDVIMPRMNGEQLAKLLAAERPEMRRIFMSGYAGETISRGGVDESSSHFLAKPFTRELLAQRVREVLDEV